MTSQSSEQVNATVSNAAGSTTSALSDASSTGFGGVLASNKVDGSAIAYIDETGIAAEIDAAGALVVSAADNSGIYSNVKLVSSAIVTSDGGTGALNASFNSSPGADFVTTPTGGGVVNDQTLVFGNMVQIAAGYDTPTYTVGAAGLSSVVLNPGDVIADGSTLYRYIGAGTKTVDLATDPGLAADPTDYAVIAGQEGATYKYMGPPAATGYTGKTYDLNNTDYTDLGFWQLVPLTNVIPSGLNTPAPDSAPSDTSTGAPKKPSPCRMIRAVRPNPRARRRSAASWFSTMIGRRRKPMSSTRRSRPTTATVSAVDNAAITATNDSTVVAESSTLGSGSNLALNGIIATNLVQNSATRDVESSSITASDPATPARRPAERGGGPVDHRREQREHQRDQRRADLRRRQGRRHRAGVQHDRLAVEQFPVQRGGRAARQQRADHLRFGESPETNVTAYADSSTLDATTAACRSRRACRPRSTR